MIRFLRRLFITTLLLILAVVFGSGAIVSAILLKPWRLPNHYRYETLADIKVPGDDILLQTKDGLTLAGWWALHPDAHGRTIILCHALGADRRQMLPIIHFLFYAGYNILAFDWRNNGQSEGRLTTFGEGEKLDLQAAFDFLDSRPELSHARIALLGLSFGASIALLEAADSDVPRALILDSPYADLYQLLRERAKGMHLPEFPVVPLAMFLSEIAAGFHHSDVRPERWVDRVTVPVLYIQGQADRLTPKHHVLDLFKRTPGPKELWIVPNAGHGLAYQTEPHRYEKTVLQFLKRNFHADSPPRRGGEWH